MTSFAFISGLIPLTIASGAGALGNRSIGTAAAGGMLIGTFVGIFLIRGFYVIFESLAIYFKKRKRKSKLKKTSMCIDKMRYIMIGCALALIALAGCKTPELSMDERISPGIRRDGNERHYVREAVVVDVFSKIPYCEAMWMWFTQ